MKYDKFFNIVCSQAWLRMREALKSIAIRNSDCNTDTPKQAEELGLSQSSCDSTIKNGSILEFCEVFEHALDQYRKDLEGIAYVYKLSYNKILNFMNQRKFSEEHKKTWLRFLPALGNKDFSCPLPKMLPTPEEFLNFCPQETYECITDTIVKEGALKTPLAGSLPQVPHQSRVRSVQTKSTNGLLPPLEHTKQEELSKPFEALNIQEKPSQPVLPAQSVPSAEIVVPALEKVPDHKDKVEVSADSPIARATEDVSRSVQYQLQENLPFAIGEGAKPWLFAARVRAWEDESCDPITYDSHYTQKQLSLGAKAQIRRYHTLPRAILTVAVHYGRSYSLNDEEGHLLRTCITVPAEVQGCGESTYYDKGIITIAIDASLKQIFHFFFEQKSRSTILRDIQQLGYIPANEEICLATGPAAGHRTLDDDGSRIVDIHEDGAVLVFDKRHNMLWTLDKF